MHSFCAACTALTHNLSHHPVTASGFATERIKEMARKSRARTFRPGLLPAVLISLLACAGQTEPIGPDLRCPDYVVDYAPFIWLHPEEKYMPSDLLAHIRHTTPFLDGKPIEGLPSLDLDNLEVLNKYGDRVALTSNDNILSNPPWLFGETPDATGRLHNSTACVVILVEKNDVDLDAFYFYFYTYNQGSNVTQVLEPIKSLLKGDEEQMAIHFGDHVGDWEHNMVRFQNGKPTGIFYSQHVDGGAYQWDDKIVSKTKVGRPVVYSALGTHANYPTTGQQVHNAVIIDLSDAGQIWDPVLSAYFYRFEPDSFTITPLVPPKESSPQSSPANFTSFFYFKGIWGDTQYADSDPRQKTDPHFGVKRFLDGPTGPRDKHLVRKGLRPDEKRYMSWTEWAVTLFMAWYPCCIRGWRKWISLGVIIASIAGIVVGIILGIRTYRVRRTYRKVQVEDIPLVDRRREEEGLLSSSDDDKDD